MTSTTGAPTELSVQGESLQRLYNQYVEDRFLVNRRYQRKLVWAVDEKAKLIDSVIQQLPIPLILLAETTVEGLAKFEVIDGLQRLNSVFAFIENEYPLEGGYFDLETLADTKYLRDEGRLTQKEPKLARDLCRDIANYQLPVSTYRSAAEASVDEVFRRINSSGRHLSLQEIRQAGATVEIANLVRRVSATVRGDASFTDYVALQDMPKISITSQEVGYGILDSSIFWVEQGILSKEAVRESRDEELVLDILMDLILDPLASSGSEYRNAAYGDERGPASTSAATVNSRLAVIGYEEVESRFTTTLDMLRAVLESVGSTYASWTVTQINPRGVPRHFHALFVALAKLVHEEDLTPKEGGGLAAALKGFWDKDLSVPGGGNWGGDRKAGLIHAVMGLLRPNFEPTTDEHRQRLREQSLAFESTLRMALTESALFELKQGFCQLNMPGVVDELSLNKVWRTASAMANSGPGVRGVIFFGVADDRADAEAIQRFSGVEPSIVGNDDFFVTGTQHELTALGRSVDEHYRWITDHIKAAKLETTFAAALADTLSPFRYKNYLLWRLEPTGQRSPVAYDGKFHKRQGPRTVEVIEAADVVELVRRFPA